MENVSSPRISVIRSTRSSSSCAYENSFVGKRIMDVGHFNIVSEAPSPSFLPEVVTLLPDFGASPMVSFDRVETSNSTSDQERETAAGLTTKTLETKFAVSCSSASGLEDGEREVIESQSVDEVRLSSDSSVTINDPRKENDSLATGCKQLAETCGSASVPTDTGSICGDGEESADESSPLSINLETIPKDVGDLGVAFAECNEETVTPPNVLIVENVSSDPAILSNITDVPLMQSASLDLVGSMLGGRRRYIPSLDCLPPWGCVSICGRRPEMEDAVAAVPKFVTLPTTYLCDCQILDQIQKKPETCTLHFFGVYDGHGGCQVANFCRDRVHTALVEELENMCDNILDDGSWKKCWEKALVNCFLEVDAEIEGKTIINGEIQPPADGKEPIAPETVGSTAVVAILSSYQIIVANCGDSRAVLCRGKEAIPLSVDHKPNRDDEYARIEAAGGKVIQWNGYRVFGVLAMSRSIGDRYLKPWIIPDPEVTFVSRTKEEECLILASDGLWDVIPNEEACDIARRRILHWYKKNGVTSPTERSQGVDPAAQSAADHLSKLALQRGTKDNVTVIVIDLKERRKVRIRT